MQLGELARKAPEVVVLEPYEGSGGRGPIFGEAKRIECRVEWRRRLVEGGNGAQRISEATLFCEPTVDPPLESRVLIDGVRYEVAEVLKHRGLSLDYYQTEVLVAP
jgi:hypothetical protein